MVYPDRAGPAYWKEGAVVIHTMDPVLFLRYALLHHNFRLTGRGGAPSSGANIAR